LLSLIKGSEREVISVAGHFTGRKYVLSILTVQQSYADNKDACKNLENPHNKNSI
jgi:hypothetical protein